MTSAVSADRHPENNTDPGNDTRDQVFLLSLAEAETYFGSSEERTCEPTEYAIGKNKEFKHLLPYEFTYGYAITTHRAQGSEWDKVLVIEEKFPFNKEEHARWLYTACTRASKKLVVIRAE